MRNTQPCGKAKKKKFFKTITIVIVNEERIIREFYTARKKFG
jgi:hypothetical protein